MKRAFARHLRGNLTGAERLLWRVLRRKALDGWRFRRQIPLGPYIVDFCCLPLRLVIEADGGQHNASPGDLARDDWLRSEGFTVLRFWNNDIAANMDGIWRVIQETADALAASAQLPEGGHREGRHPLPTLPPRGGGLKGQSGYPRAGFSVAPRSHPGCTGGSLGVTR